MLRRVSIGLLTFLGLVALIILLAIGFAPWMDGPLNRIAGGSFQQATSPGQADATVLSTTGAVELEVQLESRPSVSVAVIVHDNTAYVPATLTPAEKRWPQAILDDPAVRLRANGHVYGYNAYKVEDPQLHLLLSRLGAEKYSEAYFKPENTWFFRLTTQGEDG